MEFRRLTQPNDWTCWPTVAAMVTGATVEDVIAFLGHDGGEEDPTGPLVSGKRRRALWDEEIMAYLATRGWTLGLWLNGQGEAKAKDWDWKEVPAVLFVKSERFEGCTHVVLWTGQVVLDPNPNAAPSRRLEEYEVKTWWPLIHWGPRFFDRLSYDASAPTPRCAHG